MSTSPINITKGEPTTKKCEKSNSTTRKQFIYFYAMNVINIDVLYLFRLCDAGSETN